MTCSTSSSSRVAGATAALLLLTSCALWSPPAGPPLEFGSLRSDLGDRPARRPMTIRWTASCSGGTGDLVYEWKTLGAAAEIVEQVGPTPTWDWSPDRAGSFRVMVTVEDAAGRRVDSGWSDPVVILPAVGSGDVIAVLPSQNLTGWLAPTDSLDQLLRLRLQDRGFRLVEDEVLDDFMRRHRIRDTGGVDSDTARAALEELGADALLVTSLERFNDGSPPSVAVFARLVTSGAPPEIAWMDSVGMSGGAHPGLLGLGRIFSAGILLEKSVDCLTASLARSLPELAEELGPDVPPEAVECDTRAELVALSPGEKGKRRYRPRTVFRSPAVAVDRRYRVAVVPFSNVTDRKNAGTLVALHFINQMVRSEQLHVIEPGLVKQALLENRIIMEEGPSLENAEVLAGDESLEADLVFAGSVFDYQDAVGIPKVDFSVTIIDKPSQRVVWASRSHNTGVEGVLFFGLGTVYTAHHLASQMARGTFEVMTQ